MIRNETEYQEASARLADERNRLADHRAKLNETGLSDEEVKRVVDPMESFHLQLKEEVESYERLKRGEFEELDNLRGLGHLLISLRIAQGISQRELTCTSRRYRVTSATSILASHSNERLNPGHAQRAAAYNHRNRTASCSGHYLNGF
jgi:hypothetical protein